ncbi:MAG: transcriptional regulator [Thermoprotei archaeon]|nr:MAG: transcriptional regulator [Thermoprotei archaeon]
MKIREILASINMPEDVVSFYESEGRLDEVVNVPNEEVVNKVIKILKCLANPVRLKMLALLRKPHCVCLLSCVLGLDLTLVSHHLAKLRRKGLVDMKPIARARIYERKNETIKLAIKELLDLLGISPYELVQ